MRKPKHSRRTHQTMPILGTRFGLAALIWTLLDADDDPAWAEDVFPRDGDAAGAVAPLTLTEVVVAAAPEPGQYVVYAVKTSVTTEPTGQFVTVAAQDVMVYVFVLRIVDVVTDCVVELEYRVPESGVGEMGEIVPGNVGARDAIGLQLATRTPWQSVPA
jgi:hypothetical protein